MRHAVGSRIMWAAEECVSFFWTQLCVPCCWAGRKLWVVETKPSFTWVLLAVWIELWQWCSQTPVRSLLFTPICCSAFPFIYLVQMFPQPSPACPLWTPRLVPAPQSNSSSFCGFPCSLFSSPPQGLGVWSSLSRECCAGWMSAISVSQVGTIPSLLGWCQDQDSRACKGFWPPAGRCLSVWLFSLQTTLQGWKITLFFKKPRVWLSDPEFRFY